MNLLNRIERTLSDSNSGKDDVGINALFTAAEAGSWKFFSALSIVMRELEDGFLSFPEGAVTTELKNDFIVSSARKKIAEAKEA